MLLKLWSELTALKTQPTEISKDLYCYLILSKYLLCAIYVYACKTSIAFSSKTAHFPLLVYANLKYY